MLVTAISDTHCKFHKDLPGGNLLVHAGDFTFRGREEEVIPFMKWMQTKLSIYDRIAITAGNHELSFEQDREEVKKWLQPYLSDRFTYTEHGVVEVEGFKLFLSAYTPWFHSWAFNVRRGNLHYYWDQIPDDTDLLVTHGPPKNFGDFVEERRWGINELGQEAWETFFRHEGDDELLEAVKRVKPAYHVFGHFHGAAGKYYGKDDLEGVVFLNASSCNEAYDLVNKPIQFVLDKPKGKAS